MNLDLFEPVTETQKQRVNNALPNELPHQPGVYTMYANNDEVLYVGKAKNLRKRLTSYRYSSSKKIQRMIANLNRIGIEICKSEVDAILLENLLIRSLRPPFNTVNKKPETYYFISTIRRGNHREFRLSMRRLQEYSHTYGCFKGHLRIRKGLGALLKLLYVSEYLIDSAHYLPTQLLNRITPMRFKIPISTELSEKVDELLSGNSDQLITMLEGQITELEFRDKFTERYLTQEIDHLKIFYELGPVRNKRMYLELELDSPLIMQEHYDDLQVLLSERRN